MPLQSSSSVLQLSVLAAPAVALHTVAPAGAAELQIFTPTRPHAPTPLVQTVPLSGWVSSVDPSQSLSRASHTSVPAAPAVTEHTVAPAGLAELQIVTPARRQIPLPTVQTVPLVG